MWLWCHRRRRVCLLVAASPLTSPSLIYYDSDEHLPGLMAPAPPRKATVRAPAPSLNALPIHPPRSASPVSGTAASLGGPPCRHSPASPPPHKLSISSDGRDHRGKLAPKRSHVFTVTWFTGLGSQVLHLLEVDDWRRLRLSVLSQETLDNFIGGDERWR
ncbi:hypothetical protein E2C01_085252 [Portunus trituberculatus]|uniref:Uncharacterized protein n=1 Tax=Portunus trituberculatus TaxID=210409 RepID=A0A5B7J6B8_PORTR|nr:hypothetical protein [Portunus trituberculatus]